MATTVFTGWRKVTPGPCQERVDAEDAEGEELNAEGYYWWPCFPGCLPDGEPIGPFATEEEAIADARSDFDGA